MKRQGQRGEPRSGDPLKITICEMPDDRGEFDEAWEMLSRHVRRESSDAVLLPEMPFYHWFCAGPKYDPDVWEDAVRTHERWARRLSELGAPVVFGSRPIDQEGRRVNQGFAWTKSGLKGVHLKNYLPDEPGFYEARWYDRGRGPFRPFEVRGWKAGFMICSDLWSMADASAYGRGGVELILVPRATGSPDAKSRWVAGGRVAATIAGAYCASSNRVGKRGEATFGGHGWIMEPDGDVLGLTSRRQPFVTVKIERSKADAAKVTYPRYTFGRA